MILLSGLNDPNGIAWHNGSLYVAEISKITRYDDADAFVIANKVRHCQTSFVDHDSIPRSHAQTALWLLLRCMLCQAAIMKLNSDVRPPHSVGSVEILSVSAAAMLSKSSMLAFVCAPLHIQAAQLS